jgi:hypothetical protein
MILIKSIELQSTQVFEWVQTMSTPFIFFKLI